MILTLFESVQKAYTRPEWIVDNSWEEIAKFLLTHQEGETKESIPLFNLWQFDQQGELGRKRIYENNTPTENYEEVSGTIRRCKKNAQFCWGLVLDYDGKATTSEAIERFSTFTFALYTSFRHTLETNKFRVIFPFKSPATVQELKEKRTSLQETFQEVDNASFSESQSFYLHSGPNPYTYYNEGAYLDLDWFENEVIETPTPIIRCEFTGDRDHYKEMLIDSLASCSGLHYANEASKHGVLTLVALCKSAGLNYEEYNTLCWNMAASDSSLREENYRKNAWLGWTPFSGITAKVREEFISAYGGTSKFAKKEMTTEEIKEYVRRKYER